MERVVEALKVSDAPFDDVPPRVLYGILRLRAEVFVIEQTCIYLDPDGRDLEAGARLLWVEGDDGSVVGCARVLPEADGSSIGRIVAGPSRRNRGIGGAMVRRALELAMRPTRINAQSHLAGWYATFGFFVDGDEFVEDGIPHTPMVKST